MIQIIRNNHIESLHFGSAVVIGPNRNTIIEWGDADSLIFPRSSMKIIQAIPLIESGAAHHYKLGSQELAMACSSHQGSTIHTKIIENWLAALDLSQNDLKCGVQPPSDKTERQKLRDCMEKPSQVHNNCSGKHAGFLTFVKHKNLSFEYNDINHPLQRKIRVILGELSGEEIKNYGIDGCSAPNFMCSVRGLANAMYALTDFVSLGKIRSKAVQNILDGMQTHPFLVAGIGRACSELMVATESPVVVKTGAEGVFVAVLPEHKLGVALKILDGSTRAAEAAITLILVRLGVLSQNHPATKRRLFSEIRNWNRKITGYVSPTERFWDLGKKLI